MFLRYWDALVVFRAGGGHRAVSSSQGGLSVILVFIGVKMLIDPQNHPPRWFQYDIPTTRAA